MYFLRCVFFVVLKRFLVFFCVFFVGGHYFDVKNLKFTHSRDTTAVKTVTKSSNIKINTKCTDNSSVTAQGHHTLSNTT